MEWRRAKARSSLLEWSSVDGDHFGFVALGAPKNPIAVDEEESDDRGGRGQGDDDASAGGDNSMLALLVA
jgi:hypothetical protein